MYKSPGWTVVSHKAAANISYQALLPALVLTTLALATVVLRWYSRARLSSVYGVEDAVVTLALVFSMFFTGIVGGEFAIDTSTANDEVQVPLLATMKKLMFAQSIAYHSAVNLVRFSILFQYCRVFQHVHRLRLCIYIVGAATLAAISWGVFGIVFLCRPVQKYWASSTPGKCMDAEDHFWSCAILGIVLDFVIWVMPMPVLGRLRLERRQKVGLLVPFGLGLFVCIVSILRCVCVYAAAEKGDVSKSGTYAAIWSTAEVNVAIICSSLLVMKPLLSRMIPSLSASKMVTAREADSGIRRVMSIVTLEESMAGTEGSLLPSCAAYVWTDSSEGVGDIIHSRVV